VEEIIDANANEGVLYQIERHAKDGPFSYSLGVDPGKRYCITFKLAEIFWKADPDEWAERGWVYNGWKRVFDIWVEGEVAFSNVNTFEQAGALYKAHDLKYEYAATDSNLNIEFKNVIKKAKVNAILVEEIPSNTLGPTTNPTRIPSEMPTEMPTPTPTKAHIEVPTTSSPTHTPTKIPTVTPTTSPIRNPDRMSVIHAINVGSDVDFVNGDGITYKGDYGYSTSGTFDVEEIIDANANEGVLYQIERHAKDGPFSYSLGVDPGKRYCITFKLAEIFWKADPDEWAERGWVYNGWKRVFDIWVEGEVAFSNVNTFEQAGALYKAHDLKYEYAATDSNLNIEFKNVIKKAKVNAILVEEFTLGSPEPTHNPTKFPTGLLTTPPSRNPTRTPMANPTTTSSPTKFPMGSPTKGPTDVAATYVPGDLTVPCEGLTLSTGLACRMLTMRGSKIQFEDGTESSVNMHQRPDGAAVIPHPTDGGWYYLSNSEMNNDQGLVGSLRFNSDGHLIDYQTHLTTSRNCGGGRTPWNTWVSCEENSNNGVCWEVDPYTEFEQETLVTDIGGNYESFAYDNQDPSAPNSTRYFVTEDSSNGALIRYTPHPNAYNTDSNYDILSSPDGTHEFLILNPDDLTFHWTTDRTQGENNATDIFPYTEGIDCHNRILNFVSKTRKTLFTLDLEMGTYIASSTVSGLFDLQPDQLKRAVGDGKILYFAEDGGNDCDIHGRDSTGQYFTIVRGDDYPTETTGLAFSPNGIYFYAAYQTDANIFVFWRTDGLPFNGIVADTKYHTSR